MKNTLHWGSTPRYVRYGYEKPVCKCRYSTLFKRMLKCDPCREEEE